MLSKSKSLFLTVAQMFRRTRSQPLIGEKPANHEFRVSRNDKTKAMAYYDAAAEKYDETINKGILKRFRDRERRLVLELAKLDECKGTMIDVGCGNGFYALCGKKSGLVVHACDTSMRMVEKISGKIDNVKVADVETLKTTDKYQRVICAGVLDFVQNPEKAFENLASLVAPGGKLVILAPRRGLGGLFYRIEKWSFGFKVNLFSLKWFTERANTCGLIVEEFRKPLPTNIAIAFSKPVS